MCFPLLMLVKVCPDGLCQDMEFLVRQTPECITDQDAYPGIIFLSLFFGARNQSPPQSVSPLISSGKFSISSSITSISQRKAMFVARWLK